MIRNNNLEIISSKIKSFQDMTGKLQCLYGKCAWLESNKLMLYDVKGQNLAKIKTEENIFDFEIYMNNYQIRNVIPQTPKNLKLSKENILSWTQNQTLPNMTYSLNIETVLSSTKFEHLYVTFLNISNITNVLKPYSTLKINIISETPWAKSEEILSQTIYLPMGIPGEPRNFQIFVEQPM